MRYIKINPKFTQVTGRRSFSAPHGSYLPNNGRWNVNGKTSLRPPQYRTGLWSIFPRNAMPGQALVRDLMRCGDMKGIRFQHSNMFIEEEPAMRRAPAAVGVESMITEAQKKRRAGSFGAPKFIMCILAERKNSDRYVALNRSIESPMAIEVVDHST